MSSSQEVGLIFGDGVGPAQMMLRSPTVLILSIALWGMNIYFFRVFGINYVYTLNLDLVKERERELSSSGGSSDNDTEPLVKDHTKVPLGERITSYKLINLSVLLLLLLYATIYVWMEVLGRGFIGAVFAYYAAVAVAIMIPLHSTSWLRIGTVMVLRRAWELINPRCSCIVMKPEGPRPIPFIDVFFADAMCSLSKVFFDWGMLLHLASHYPSPVPKTHAMILIPSAFAAIPYLIRARQCLIMHRVGLIKNDPKRYQHILNAIKYSTSVWPICLSAYQQTLPPGEGAKYETTLIVLIIINSLYALSWDITMDWGMMQDPTAVIATAGAPCIPSGMATTSNSNKPPNCVHTCLRPRLRFGLCASAGILIADALLRFAWLLRFAEHYIFPSKDMFVLTTQFLEVFRRALWNLIRVEWEQLKHSKQGLGPGKGGGGGGFSSDDEDEEAIELLTSSQQQQSQQQHQTNGSTRKHLSPNI